MAFHQIENYLSSKSHIGIFLLRIFVGLRILYGVVDNVLSWERMMEFSGFLQQHHFPLPTVSAITSVYLQLICALLILVGYQTRIASILMVINFLVALLFVHLPAADSVEGMTPALAMLFGALTLVFTGAGRWSVDERKENT